MVHCRGVVFLRIMAHCVVLGDYHGQVDSLPIPGFLALFGSLQRGGFLIYQGSLLKAGFLRYSGSLHDDGFLWASGSLAV